MPIGRKSLVDRLRRMGFSGVSIWSFVIIAGAQTILPSQSVAQQHEAHDSAQALEPILDGSLSPYAIPDDIAIRVLMQTLLEPRDPEANVIKPLRPRVGRLDLSDADKEILVLELSVLDARLQEHRVRIEAVRPSSAAADSADFELYVDEQRKLRSSMSDHYNRLLASLSPDGAAKLQDELLQVRSQIRIYPMPDMSASVKR